MPWQKIEAETGIPQTTCRDIVKRYAKSPPAPETSEAGATQEGQF
jgi:hypothetical protein